MHATDRKEGSLSAFVFRIISCPTRKHSGIKSCFSQKSGHFRKALHTQRCFCTNNVLRRDGDFCRSSSQFTAGSTLTATLKISRNKSWLKMKSRETSETKAHPTALQQNVLCVYFLFLRGRKQQTTISVVLSLLSTCCRPGDTTGQALGEIKHHTSNVVRNTIWPLDTFLRV